MESSTRSKLPGSVVDDADAVIASWRPRSDRGVLHAKVESFLSDVTFAASLADGVASEEAAAATVWVLAQRLGSHETQRLLASLPPPVRALFDVFQVRHGSIAEDFDGCEFHDRVAAMLSVEREDVEVIGRGVFRALRARLPTHEVDDVARLLPVDLRADWLNVSPSERLPSGLAPTPQSLDLLAAAVEAGPRLPAGVCGVHALVTVLCALADVLEPAQLEQLAHALPGPLRPMLTATGARILASNREAPAFLSTVGELLSIDEGAAAEVVRRVFAATQPMLPAACIEELSRSLPPSLRQLWQSG